jgi:hypothetical protein
VNKLHDNDQWKKVFVDEKWMDGEATIRKINNCNLTLHDNDLPKKHWVDETWMDGKAIKHKSCSDLTYYMMIAYWRSVGWIKMDEQRGK